MTVLKHEIKQGRISLLIWAAAIAGLLACCVLIFPEMGSQMDKVAEMYSSMGSLTAAFGMDKLNMGELLGFYGIECGNILGLGGALYAALIGISSLAKEQKDHTAEFLMSHPVSRVRIITEKLCAVLLQILIMNVVVLLITVLSIIIIKESPDWGILVLLHLAYTIMQIEIAAICFGISAFIRRGGIGTGLGIAAIMYFMNIIANLTDKAEFLKYITPFGYTESANIITEKSIDTRMLLFGASYTVIAIVTGYVKYCRKDIS